MTKMSTALTIVTWLVHDQARHRWILRERADTRGFAREVAVLDALRRDGLPVPDVVGYDDGCRGGSFVVTTCVDGSPLGDGTSHLSPIVGRSLVIQVIDLLARLHDTPVIPAIPRFAAGHLDRQFACMTDLWLRSGSGGAHDSAWRAVRARLIQTRPRDEPRATLVHGDFRLQNVRCADGRITGLLGWDRCTVGNPLSDLAWLVNSWAATPGDGVPDRYELVEIYRSRMSIALGDLNFHRGMAHWISATLLQAMETTRRTSGEHQHQPADVDLAIQHELISAAELLGRIR
jgi:aminoglycoside phosphotransferase (APT) family kinase protein